MGFELGSGAVGNATPGQVLSPATFSSTASGVGVAGTMPDNGALGTYTPGTSAQAIPAGHTSGGTVAGDANLVGGNIKPGVSIFGVASTMPSQNAVNITPSTVSQTAIAAGTYAAGAATVSGDPNLVSANIGYGVSIFGVAGSFGNVRVASGSGSLSSTGSSFTKTTGGSLTAPSATVPVPSGATRIHAVIVVSTSNSESPPFSGVAGTGYQSLTIASALGYMDGGGASTLAVMHSTEYGWNSFASGGVLSVSASSIVLPAVATNYGDTFYYTVIWD